MDNNDESAIRALIAAWLTETRAGNVAAVLELMAPDAVFLVAGQPPMVGRDAFAASLRNVLDNNVIDSNSIVDEVVVAGDLAYSRSRLEVTITSKHGQTPMRRSGHTLSVFKKEGGQWRLIRDANMLA
ncbi:MAG: ketosteroid isomerase [Massilia sp.]|nr:ketosteroid isomerase [Massilia sp.]